MYLYPYDASAILECMRSKHQTPLGYLMGMLDVSLADLADYLYVAQTSVSKWKTGARALKPSSDHFTGIVEYFVMLSRDPARKEKLERLFAQLYPDQSVQTPQELAERLRTFLQSKQLPTISAQQALGEEGSLYTAQFTVYSADAGVRSAVGQFCAFLQEQKPCTILVAESMSRGVLPDLLPALEKGCRMKALMAPPPPAALLEGAMGVLSHPSAHVRLLPGPMPSIYGAGMYLAQAGMLLNTRMTAGQTAYAALFADELTLHQHQYAFDADWDALPDAFETISQEQLKPDTYLQLTQETVPETLDWLLPSLPCLTMSHNLLMEVLKANGVSGRVWTHVLSGCELLARLPMRILVPVGALSQPQERAPLLSLLSGRDIRLTREQSMRHLLDTAALLRADSAISIVPLQGKLPELWHAVSAFVKRNAFCGYLRFASQTIRASSNPLLVTAMSDAFDALYQGMTQQIRQPAYVAGLLEKAALGQDGYPSPEPPQ